MSVGVKDDFSDCRSILYSESVTVGLYYTLNQ